ncbi:adenine phosphoribosyltransferase [Oleiagrimonas sp. C23AA]|uniref:adenine phosphoribosyltransferase n=1 Tax=Oleiagrimonas sp. C23AA TaxID=2719047 RepID=UPI00142000F7|nr:adenine phosphoribosyltransferase [Oleiagrimonas sp. C23AA]NII09988.1 adenine phosphoribosyltransferase [Oleiagrimonas sp. C23AA]
MPDFDHLIRDIPDFPKPGIVFKDISPLLGDAEGFAACVRTLGEAWRESRISHVAGIESRGFIFGAALATELGAGFVPLRKPGKLPADTIAVDYALEYGHDRLEAHADALPPGARVLLIDDVLATGGTLRAAAELIGQLGATLAGAAVVVELVFLGGRERWRESAPLTALLRYE